MLCTLVIAIETFPYALRAVAVPWSLDQDMCVCVCVCVCIQHVCMYVCMYMRMYILAAYCMSPFCSIIYIMQVAADIQAGMRRAIPHPPAPAAAKDGRAEELHTRSLTNSFRPHSISDTELASSVTQPAMPGFVVL
jgi:hypothetical protein